MKIKPFDEDELEPLETATAEDREAFERVKNDDFHALGRAAEEEQERYLKGKDEEEEEEEDETSDSDQPEGEAQDESEEETEKRTVDAEKARKALKLRKVSDDVLEKLSDEDALSLWASLEEREKHVDRILEENAELKKKATGDSEPPEPTGSKDLDEAIEEIADALGDQEAAEAIGKVLKAHSERLAKAEEAARKRELEARDVMLEATRDQHRERFPELEDPEVWSKVRRRMALLAQDPEYTELSPRDALGPMLVEAARSVGLSESKGNRTKAAKRDVEGKFRPSSRKTKKALSELTPEERDRVVFEHLRAHPGDVQGARKAAGLL